MILQLLILFLFNTTDVGYKEFKPTKNEFSYCKLKISDFKTKTTLDKTAAETVTSIGYSYDGESKVTVFCQFDKNESFITVKGKTAYILNHEQRHFDITYVYALKFVKELSMQKQLTESIVQGIYEKILSEKDNLQSDYDNQTNNSENKELQAVWDIKIDKFLINL